jgi:outer membrane lipoprotein-sorting protein
MIERGSAMKFVKWDSLKWIGMAILGLATFQVGIKAAEEELAPETRRILTQMDRANQTLTDLSANIKQTKIIIAVNDTSTDTGKLFFRKEKKGNKTKFEYETPEPKTILIDKGKVQIYEPKINRFYEPNLAKNQAESEFFMVGFGSSANLTKVYNARFLKEEYINGHKTSLLELKPKSASAMFAKIQLWVDQTNWLPAQIRLFETTGDHLTVLFEGVKINPGLKDSVFKIKH